MDTAPPINSLIFQCFYHPYQIRGVVAGLLGSFPFKLSLDHIFIISLAILSPSSLSFKRNQPFQIVAQAALPVFLESVQHFKSIIGAINANKKTEKQDYR